MEKQSEKKLTAKEQAWAEAYLVTLNKAESARRAKYKGNDAQLAVIGYQNYRKLHIRAYLDARMADLTMPANEILKRLTDMASSSLPDYAHIRDSRDLADCENGHVIKKFKKTTITTEKGSEVETVELELYDALSALEKLGKYHALFTDKVEHSGTVNSNIVLLPTKS